MMAIPPQVLQAPPRYACKHRISFPALVLIDLYYPALIFSSPRGRGRPKTRFTDDITKACGGIHAMVQQAKDQRVCRRFVKEATVIRNRVKMRRMNLHQFMLLCVTLHFSTLLCVALCDSMFQSHSAYQC